MLRYLGVIQFGLLRQATQDFQLDDVTIKTGEWIVNATAAANRDPEVFGDSADRIDLARDAKTHLTFGFGVHQCLGQQLARIELAEMFKSLYRRIPTLRLAVPVEDIPLKEASFVYGVKSMPVTWDA
jgi:cytochrome P450